MMRALFCRTIFLFLFSVISISVSCAQEKPWQAIGRTATAEEVKAWDIDVRGDFKGIPKGKGSVAQGEKIWEEKCASCHGVFAESNEFFPPLVGGTTSEDSKVGVVASNRKGDVAQRTMMMKLAKLSTLWDYINRAMPWNAPKSLSTDEVYAVTAYILNLANIVPADYVLHENNIALVQEKLPNRFGLKEYAGLWDVKGTGDVKNIACMKNCEIDPQVSSYLPDFARNAHGNLAEQNRIVGEVRGVDTTQAPLASLEKSSLLVKNNIATVELKKTSRETTPSSTAHTINIQQVLAKNTCTACHGIGNKIIGPSFVDIAKKYKNNTGSELYLLTKIKSGGSGVWGNVAMPAQTQLAESDAKIIVHWLASGPK